MLYILYHAVTGRKSIWVSLNASLAHAWALKQHQKAALTLNKRKSALAEHVCDTKHVIALENSKIITTNNGQRRCLEAWHTNMNHHALNRDDGSYLPQEYFYLVGKGVVGKSLPQPLLRKYLMYLKKNWRKGLNFVFFSFCVVIHVYFAGIVSLYLLFFSLQLLESRRDRHVIIYQLC